MAKQQRIDPGKITPAAKPVDTNKFSALGRETTQKDFQQTTYFKILQFKIERNSRRSFE